MILFRVVDFEIIKWTNKKQTKPSKTGLRWYFVSSRVFDASLAESGCELWLAQWLPLGSSSEMRFYLNSSPKTTNWENTYCKNFWILQDTIYIYTFEHIIKSLVDYRKNFKRYLNIDQGGKLKSDVNKLSGFCINSLDTEEEVIKKYTWKYKTNYITFNRYRNKKCWIILTHLLMGDYSQSKWGNLHLNFGMFFPYCAYTHICE